MEGKQEFEKYVLLTEFIQEMANTGRSPHDWTGFLFELNQVCKLKDSSTLHSEFEKARELINDTKDQLRSANSGRCSSGVTCCCMQCVKSGILKKLTTFLNEGKK